MAFAYVLDPCLQHQNRAGVNNVHGYFKVYLAGTDDLAETYSDFGGSLNPENIEIDNNGRCVIIADSSHPYRVEMYLPNGDLVYTQEPVWTLASGGGASIIDIESTDASVQIDKTTVGGKVTYDLSVGEDDPNRLDWIKCLGAHLVDGIYVPQKSAGTLNMGEKGISLEAEMYYHATVRVKATKNPQRLPYYDEVNVVLGLWDGETTTTIGTYKRIVDYSLGLSQEFEVGADIKVGNLNSQLVISITGQDHQGGDFEIPEVDLHRVYSGVPRLPAGVATRAWVNENFQKKLVPGENITIDPVTNEISADLPEQEQSDWAEDDSSKPDYIKNKPNLAAVATSGSYDDLSDKPSIPDAQVQSDWAQTDPSAVDFIENKPDLSGFATKTEVTQGLAGKQDVINDLATIRSGAAKGATSVQPGDLASVATSGSYNDLSNKPSIPAAQVNADWNAGSGVAEILNKPQNLVQDANYVHTDNNFTTSEKDKLAGVQAGAEVNVQSDWNQSNSSADDFIKNKPDISLLATKQEVTTGLAGKQDTISDLSTIRSGASAGATAVQPATMTAALALKEDSANKAQTLDPASTTEFPSSAATASFVNSSVATNTATFRGNFKLPDLGLTYPATDAQIETALDAHTWPVGVVPTNNDYVYVEIQNPQTTSIDDVVKRFKYNGSGWHYEYTLNNSSFTAAEKAAIDSGVDSAKVAIYDAHVANGDIHVTTAEKTAWNAKQGAISDLSTIRSGAAAGATAVQPGDLAAVATSGNYDDLSNKPTIPAELVAGTGISITPNLDGTKTISLDIPVADTEAF